MTGNSGLRTDYSGCHRDGLSKQVGRQGLGTTGRARRLGLRPVGIIARRPSVKNCLNAQQRTANTDSTDSTDFHRRRTTALSVKSAESVESGKSVFAVLIPRGAGQVERTLARTARSARLRPVFSP